MVEAVSSEAELKKAFAANTKEIVIQNEELSQKISKFVTLNKFLRGLAVPHSGNKLPKNYPLYIKLASGLEITRDDIRDMVDHRLIDPDLVYELKVNYYMIVESDSPWKLKLTLKNQPRFESQKD